MTEIRILPDPTGKKSFIVMLESGIYPNLGPVMHGMPVLSPRYSKKSKKHKYRGYGVASVPPFSPILSPVMPGIDGMPVMPGMPEILGMPGMSGMIGMPGVPGAYVIASGTTTPTAPTTPPSTGSGSGSGSTPPATPPTKTYTVITPPITNIRHITTPDADPELRRKVVKHFYNQLKEVYFIDKFKKLFKYIVVENDKARLVKSYEELQKNTNNYNNPKLKISFITDNIFSKYDLEVLISKLIAKYSMLYSDDEYNMHWYNAKYKHAKIVKKAMYKKIKYRLQKKVDF
jgi:hypothetical protein